jgi:hypothetical protein
MVLRRHLNATTTGVIECSLKWINATIRLEDKGPFGSLWGKFTDARVGIHEWVKLSELSVLSLLHYN